VVLQNVCGRGFFLVPTLFRGTSVLQEFLFVFISEQVVVLGNPAPVTYKRKLRARTHTHRISHQWFKKDGDADNEESLGEGGWAKLVVLKYYKSSKSVISSRKPAAGVGKESARTSGGEDQEHKGM
jgi:hypothetical protein